MRLAVQQSEGDGFRRNLTLNQDTNARDEFTARLRLTWNPNALSRWEAAVVAADFDNGYDEFALDNNGRNTFSDQPGRDGLGHPGALGVTTRRRARRRLLGH